MLLHGEIFFDAAQFYEGQLPGLGSRFQEEVEAALGRICEFPLAWQRLSPRTRRCLLNGFPYSVIYQHRVDEVIVVAVGHQHRAPDFWKSRMR